MTAPVPKKLAAEWRRKLRESGFQDLETTDDPDALLSRRGASRLLTPSTPLGFARDSDSETTADVLAAEDGAHDTEATGEYYAAMRHLLATQRVGDGLRRLVLQYHCDGMGLHTIAKTIPLPLRKVIKIVTRAQERIGAKPVNCDRGIRDSLRRINHRMSLKELVCFAGKICQLKHRDFSRLENVNG